MSLDPDDVQRVGGDVEQDGAICGRKQLLHGMNVGGRIKGVLFHAVAGCQTDHTGCFWSEVPQIDLGGGGGIAGVGHLHNQFAVGWKLQLQLSHKLAAVAVEGGYEHGKSHADDVSRNAFLGLFPVEQAVYLVVEACPMSACLRVGSTLAGCFRLAFELLQSV